MKNSSNSQIEAFNTDVEEPTKKLRRMSANHKTPITILNELCVKKNVGTPVFQEIQKQDLPDHFNEAHFKFFMRVTAFKKTAIGASATKQGAKHSAAQNLLMKLKENDDDDDEDDVIQCLQSTSVSSDFKRMLLNFCVQRNYHKPEFVDIDAYGQSHCPTFVCECTLDSVSCRASAPTKQMAKNLAAKKVLDILQESYPEIEEKVAIVNSRNEEIEDEVRRKITTYLELKKADNTELMGKHSKISERHNFWVDYQNEAFIEELKEEVFKDNVSDDVKYGNILRQLRNEWECKVEPLDSENQEIYKFEVLIDFEQFTCIIIQQKNALQKAVIEYFSVMLDDSE